MRIPGPAALAILPLWALASEDAAALLQEPVHHKRAFWEREPVKTRKKPKPPPAPIVGKLMTAMSNREVQHQARLQERRANVASKLEEIDAEERPVDTAEFSEKVEKVMRYVPFSNIFMPRLKRHYEDDASEVPLLAAKKAAGKKYRLKEPTEDEAEQESEASKPQKRQDEPTALARALRAARAGASDLIRDQWNMGKNAQTISWSDVKKKLGIPGSLKEAYEAEKLPANAPAHLKVIEKKMENAAKKMLTRKMEVDDEEETAPMNELEEEWQSHLYADLKSDTGSAVTKEESTEEGEEEIADEEAEAEEVKRGNAEWRKAQKEEQARKQQYQIGKEFAWPVTSEVKEMLWDKLPGSGWCVALKGGANVSRTMSQGTVCRDRCAEDPTCPGYSIQDGPSGVCGWYTDRQPEVVADDSALAFFPAGAHYTEASPDGWESGSCMRKRLPFYWRKHPNDRSKHLFGR